MMNMNAVKDRHLVDSYSSQYSSEFVSRWDELIDWEKRTKGENGFFENLLKCTNSAKVIDVSTGSGFHAVQLKKAGIEVVATDGSLTMLAKARSNFDRHEVEVESHHMDWMDIDTEKLGKFDAVLCLGSSLCHVFDESDRLKVLEKFRSLLNPGGLLIVDQRNFLAIRAGKYKSSGNYYYCGTTASVSLGQVTDRICEFIYSFDDFTTYTLSVYPLLPGQLKNEIQLSGFSFHEMYGDFKHDFDMMNSDFIIHTAIAV